MHLQPFGAFIFGFLAAAAVAVVVSMIARRKAPRPKTGSQDLDDIQDMLGALDGMVQRATHPRELLDSAAFKECAGRWSAQRHSEEKLLEQASSGNTIAACVALEALRLRKAGEETVFRLIAGLGKLQKWPLYFTLRAIVAATTKPLVGAVIAQVQEVWLRDEQGVEFIQEFVAKRIEGGETPAFGDILEDLPSPKLALMRQLLTFLEPTQVRALVEELDSVLQSRLDLEFLGSIGRVWSGKDLQDKPFQHEQLEAAVHKVRDLLLRKPRRSVLLVGETGTGKTTIVRTLASMLGESG